MNVSKLPKECLGILRTTGEIIVITRGESGYHTTQGQPNPAVFNCPDMESLCDYLNSEKGVTKAQRSAMEHGSMFGWDAPAANPDHEINKRAELAHGRE